MSLSSFFQRFRPGASSGRASVADAVPLSSSDVEAARVRARRRLIGMVVLVGAGVLGFPWLFETQPRSMSSDVQITQAPGQPGSDGGAAANPPAMTSSRSVAGRVAVSGIVEAQPSEPPKESPVDQPATQVDARAALQVRGVAAPEKLAQEVVESASKAPVVHAKPSPKDSKPAAGKDAVTATAKPAAKPSDKAADKTPAKPPEKAASKASDKPDSKVTKPASRYVVQFGAFADANTAHEARMKVERLGVKTYAQQVDTPAGKRIRVRVGPFADKAEADKAMATIRKAGLAGAVLTL